VCCINLEFWFQFLQSSQVKCIPIEQKFELIIVILISLFDSTIHFSNEERNIQNETQFISRILIGWMYDIMPQARRNLTAFPELYSNGHLILKFFSSFLSTTSFWKKLEHGKKLWEFWWDWKEVIVLGKQKKKLNKCENPLGAVYANREICQIPTCLLHE